MKNNGARWISASHKVTFAIVVLLLVALACLSQTTSQRTASLPAPVPALTPAPSLHAVDRVTSAPPALFYRHSIIPGGVQHAAGLTSALARDRFAKVHFANFDAANAYIVHVKTPRLVHVSYRLGDEIYWTKKKLQLKTGETLLTDGKSFVRTRCGNRIAETPQPKVSDREPPPEVFDKVIPPPSGTSPGPTPQSPPRPPAPPIHDDANPVPPVVWDGTPPLPPYLPPPSIELPGDVPTQVPEPASFALVLLALLCLFLIRQRPPKK